jgi:dTDP-4-dehydrorhamnose reductase
MKILVTGAGGMLGADVCEALSERDHVIVKTGRVDRPGFVALDISDTRQTVEALLLHRPDAVIHCAAWTDVDGAERTPEPAYRVNALGSWNLAYAAAQIDALLVAVSTDFVFDGTLRRPYNEFDAVNPLGAYGASKEAGERLIRETLPGRHVIARTSWLFGVHGKNFPYTILRLAQKLPEVPVVVNQIGCPTHTRDLARKLIELAEDPLPGTYHVCSAGECSWFEFATEIVRQSGLSTPVVPITADQYAERFGSPTKRPAYSPMDRLALKMRNKDDMPHWRDALADFLSRIPKN